ncbi:MAG: hypothetical protein ACE5KM_07965 [Planctomycetaceae bacterium]
MIAEQLESPTAPPMPPEYGEPIAVSPGERLKRARRAFAAADFRATVAELQAIPEINLTTEIGGLLLRARKLQQIATEARATEDEQAINDVIATAREFLSARRYGEAVAHLDAVPKAARSAELSGLLRQALADHRAELERQADLQHQWERVLQTNSREKLSEFRPNVVEQLELDPDDEYARQRLDLIDGFEFHLRNRAEKLQAAKDAYEVGNYSGTIGHLKEVHCDLWTDEIRGLHSQASLGRDQTREVARDLYRTLVGTPSPDLSGPISRLEAMSQDPASLLREGLEPDESLQLLQRMVSLAVGESNVAPFCTRVITRLKPEEYRALLEDAANGDAPPAADSTPYVLRGLFGGLIDRPLNEIRQHVRAMEPLRFVLRGNDAVQLQHWRDFLASVDAFEWMCNQKWTWWDGLIENVRTDQLEQTARQLALTADSVLSPDGDRMERLTQLLGGGSRLPRSSLLRRVFRKIRNYLTSRVWKESTAAVVSFRVATGVTVSVLGAIAVGLAGHVFFALAFGVGNLAAYVVGGMLIGIWAVFGAALNKIL